MELSEFASSCIDISDGLAKDLKSIAISSKKGFQIDIGSIPTDPKFDMFVKSHLKEECILGGGEDYELCFTASSKYSKKINMISKKHKTKITRIGVIKSTECSYFLNNKEYKPKVSGYDHFKEK